MRTRALWPAIAWVVGAYWLAYLPLVRHLPAWATLLALGAGLTRLAGARAGRDALPKLVRAVLAVAALLLVLITYQTINGLDAGTALLTVMGSLKLLETDDRRGQVVVLLVSFFLVIANLLFGQSLMLLAWMLPTVWVITIGLLQVTTDTGALPVRRAAATSGRLLLQALPLMLILFVLFPRIPGPLWGLPAQRNTAVTGIGDEMSPGSISRLIISDELAFSVEFDGRPPRNADLYWRGPVLHRFDGRTWRGIDLDWPAQPEDFTAVGPYSSYTVMLEPTHRHWLYALDTPIGYPPGSKLRYDYQLINRELVTQLKRYAVTSALRSHLKNEPSARSYDRALPEEDTNPHATALAEQWRDAGMNPQQITEAAFRTFREQPFVYTLLPERLNMRSPVDDFLFRTREGFCEHYASAFAFLMRAAGVPARVVTGYQGGELNPLTGRIEVRQADAHAWTELWIEGSGWVRYDPVGAVAPGRITNGLDDALASDEPVPGRFFRGHPWLSQLRFGWHAVNDFWKNWIVGYDSGIQHQVLDRLHLPTWREMTAAMSVLIAVWLAILALWFFNTGRYQPTDSAERLYRKFQKRLARAGIERRPSEGPVDFARRVADIRPELECGVARVTDAYIRQRYGPEPSPEGILALKEAVRALSAT